MRVDVLVGLAAMTVAVLAPSEDPAVAETVLASPAEPPPAAAPPAPESDVLAALDWSPEPTTTTVIIPATAVPATTTAEEPLPPTTEPEPEEAQATVPASVEEPPPPVATTTTEPPATTTTAPPEPEVAVDDAVQTVESPTLGGGFAELRQCESGGDYEAASPGGAYRGAYQFEQRTWDGVVARMGRSDLVGTDPADAPVTAQDGAAQQLYDERGAQPWPYCGRYL